MQLIESCPRFDDLREDVRGARRPDERLGIAVVVFDIVLDRVNEFRHAGEHTAFDCILAQVAEEAFDHVQPRGTGRSEVHMESRVALEPGSDLWMLMGGMVVDDQMQIEPGRGFAFDLAQELQPLLMTMSWQALADDGTVQCIECGKQRAWSFRCACSHA